VRKATLSRRSSTVVAFAVGAAVLTPLALSSSPAAGATNAAPARERVGAEAAHDSRAGGQWTEAPAGAVGPAARPLGRLVGSGGSAHAG
jgi:hypothetical protein